jgi:hypothetical protein
MHRLDGLTVLLISTSTVFFAGCARQRLSAPQGEPLCIADADAADAMRVAQAVLGRMCFTIEKADPNLGIIRTAPLPGGQFFELWRSDNASLLRAAEANLHAIRRWIELRFRRDQGRLCIDCTVRVQRLSLPGNEVASVSQAYLMHSRSTPDMQTFSLTPRQKAEMAWIDSDNDELLAAEILRRIAQRLAQRSVEEAS